MQKDFPRQATAELTEREREILVLIATGTSNKDIARQLSISSNTVRVHLRNIFAKIKVSSRTEAAVYAIQVGFSKPTGKSATESATALLMSLKPKRKFLFFWTAALASILLLGIVLLVFTRYRAPITAVFSPVPTSNSRWKEITTMPTARSGLAVAVYENKIYAIGGETAQEVTAMTEQYDLTTDSWITLASKPVAVTDVNAAVIGGRIYVPGGRTSSGVLTNALEIYNPRQDIWETGSNLPVAVSAYAIAAFEGQLYLFGGWDGKNYIDSVFMYDPGQDQWVELNPMLEARGNASAAVDGDKIFVIGGFDGKQALAVNNVYVPLLDDLNFAWSQAKPLSIACNDIGIASVAGNIYVIGRNGSSKIFASFLPQINQWQVFDLPPMEIGEGTRLTQLGEYLFVVGGRINNIPSAQIMAYQAIYTIQIQVIIKK